MNYRHFDYLLDLNRNLLYNLHNFLDDDFNWLDYFLPDHFLSNNFNFSDLYFLVHNFNNLLDNSWNFNDTLHSLDDRNNFLDDTVDRFVDCFNMVVDLKSLSVFNYWNRLLYDSLYDLYLRHFDDFLDYFLLIDRHFDYLFDYFFNCDNFLLDDLNFLRLLLDMVDHSLDLNYFLHFDDFLHDCRHFNHL